MVWKTSPPFIIIIVALWIWLLGCLAGWLAENTRRSQCKPYAQRRVLHTNEAHTMCIKPGLCVQFMCCELAVYVSEVHKEWCACARFDSKIM